MSIKLAINDNITYYRSSEERFQKHQNNFICYTFSQADTQKCIWLTKSNKSTYVPNPPPHRRPFTITGLWSKGSDGSGRTPLFSRARMAASTRLAWPGLGSGTRRWPTIGTPEEAKSLALVFDAKGRKLMMEQLQAMEDQQQDTAGKLKSVDVRLSFVIIYTTQCN